MQITKLYNVTNPKVFRYFIQFLQDANYKVDSKVKDWNSYKKDTVIMKFNNGTVKVTNINFIKDNHYLAKMVYA